MINAGPRSRKLRGPGPPTGRQWRNCSPTGSGILAACSPAFTRQISGLARGRTTMMMLLKPGSGEGLSRAVVEVIGGRVATGGKTPAFAHHVHGTVDRARLLTGK